MGAHDHEDCGWQRPRTLVDSDLTGEWMKTKFERFGDSVYPMGCQIR
jgi:hypothetical protein